MMQAEGGQIASFREIHKNAWLKRIPPNSNNKLLGQKKVTIERWWTVFCVHGDVEPFLEGYSEAGGVAASHMPRWRAPLSRAIHVSGSVGPARPHAEYEFVVALQDGAIRLIAPSWDSMQDWVDTLRNKLREMKILSPKENVYSKAPEQVRPRAPTRDPTSPLPAPPPGPIIRVPGTEPSIRPLPGPSNESVTICDESNSNNGTLNESPSSRSNGALSNLGQIDDLCIVTDNISSTPESNEGPLHSVESSSSDAAENSLANRIVPSSPKLLTHNQNMEDAYVNSVNNFVNKNDKPTSKSKNQKIEFQSSSSKTDCLHVLSKTGPSTSHQSDMKYSTRLTDRAEMSEIENGPSTSGIDSNKIINIVSSQKLVDDSISKVEMDFSGLAFNNEFSNSKSNLKNCEAASSSIQFNNDDANITWDELLNHKSSEFTSSVANVSGMNICLIDSVLEHRMKSESDKEFFTEFDVEDSTTVPSTSTNYSNVIITDSKDPKVKYSQVDLKAKHAKFEKFKQSLIEPLPSNALEKVKNISAQKSLNHSSIGVPSKLKPAVSPRTIIFKSCDNGMLTDATQLNLPNENQTIKNDTYIEESASDLSKSTKIHEATRLVERNRVVQNIIPIPEYQTNLNISEQKDFKEQKSIPCTSNVTIIAVSNDLRENDGSVLNHVIINEGLIKIDPKTNHSLEKSKNQSDSSYVNVSTNSQCNSFNKLPVLKDDIDLKSRSKLRNATDEKVQIKNSNENNDTSDYLLSIGSEYGHIKHSIAVGVKNENNKISNTSKLCVVNDKSIKNQSTSSSRLSPLNSFQANICDERSVITPSPSVSPKDLANSMQKLTNTTVLEIEHGASNNHKFSFDQNFVHSMNSVKLKNVSSLPNTPRQFENNTSTIDIVNSTPVVAKSDQFYESVFTPFMVSKGAKVVSENNLEQRCSSEDQLRVTALEKSAKSNKTSRNESNPHNYEFLSWKNEAIESSNVNEAGSSSKTQIIADSVHNREIPGGINDTNINQSSRGPIAIQEINLSEYRPQVVSKKNEDFSQEKALQSTKIDPPPGTSSSEAKPSLERKNGAFTTKFNNLFSKATDDKANNGKDAMHGKPLELKQVMRVESSLRRNWSEHNDRTILPIVKTAAELKAHRSRPGLNNSSNSQNVLSDSSTGEERQTRRRSSSLSESHTTSDDGSCNLVEAANNSSNNNTNGNALMLLRPKSLREQQVARLRGEMAHLGGVRLRLRTGDCPGEAMALADAYGTVWVCGWKQRTHPLLYNALHIGDRIATVGGVPITSVKQAKHALKDTSSGLYYVELVIKRLPHGRVYTLKKDSDTQDLGLIMESAEVVGIAPGSPAAQAGVMPIGTITEVNGRPLNLLMKKGDTQVRDRLNAIGRDVSILVQPTEFVALLKASLRSIRSHKDYIVQ
ncbi:uncharacterized protein LOC143910056 isoform X2 [Arctopsyche grandis]|uniref:uncharacterized protein LOC143910056 isoform X2 n=1 Tax=Arctopsyche grandis TaxID=121162 RepID=UPI00406DA39A